MKLFTLSHERSAWNQPWLPALDSDQTLVVAFGTARLDEDGSALEELRRAYPRSTLVGCSTSGEIFGTSVRDDTLVVAIARFEKTRLRTAFAKVSANDDSSAAGRALARQLAAPELRGVLVLSDGIHVNGSELVTGLNDTLPPSAMVAGGLAGDGDRFHSTWVLVDRHPRPNHACAVGFYGDAVRVQCNAAARASDDERQGELSAAGSGPTTLTASALAISRPRIERRSDVAPAAARIAAITEPYVGDVLSIAISGVGRRIALREHAESETGALLAALPQGTQQIGFYSYGAISPRSGGGLDLDHSAMTVTTLGET